MHSLQWSRIIAARPVQSTDRLGSGKARGVIWGSPGEKGLHRGVEHRREGLGGGAWRAAHPQLRGSFCLRPLRAVRTGSQSPARHLT